MGVKKWLLNGVALLIPIAFFLVLEGGLRLFNFGEDYPLFVPVPANTDYLYQNPEVARRYFKQQQNVPTSQRDFFKAQKDTNTFRIFVQGGSSAAGYPLYYGGSFSRMLEQRLLQSFPGRNIEVINTAMAAVNSYTLRDLVDEIIEQDPDLVLIYAGHNEYYGSLGVGSAESLGRFVGVVNLYLRLQHLRITQALQRGIAALFGLFSEKDTRGAPGATLMSRLAQEQEIAYQSTLYKLGIEQFRKNMGKVLEQYAFADIPVLIGTVASNEKDQTPFVSKLEPGTNEAVWRRLYQSAVTALANRDTSLALDNLAEAIAMDSVSALSYYARGQILLEMGRNLEARQAFERAKDRDQLRFRAPEEINEQIRELANRHGAIVVDVRKALREHTLDGIIGHELMLEHLHPNVEGYFITADAFYKAMYENRVIDSWTRTVPFEHARREILFTKIDSLVGQYRVAQLMNSWPFQPYGSVGAPLEITPESREEELAWALYKDEISWYEATDRLRAYYEGNGEYLNALRAALAVIQEYPFIAPPYLATASIMARQGRTDEALNYIEAANEREETAIGLSMKGSLLMQKNEYDEAVNVLERATMLNNTDEQTLFLLSGAYTMASRTEDAKRAVAQLLTINPNHSEALALFNQLNE